VSGDVKTADGTDRRIRESAADVRRSVPEAPRRGRGRSPARAMHQIAVITAGAGRVDEARDRLVRLSRDKRSVHGPNG
jgi:hypothetical protein